MSSNLAGCVICNQKKNEKLSNVTPKGLKGIVDCASARGNSDLVDYLSSNSNISHLVHNSCRIKLTRHDILANFTSVGCDGDRSRKRKLRSRDDGFNWKCMCVLCGENCESTDSKDIRHVQMERTGESIKSACELRMDEWSLEVTGRLQSCNDLMAEDAIYHVLCYKRFCANLSKVTGKSSSGRRVDNDMEVAFERLCDILEELYDTELLTLQDLYKIMQDQAPSGNTDNVYSIKHMKRRLQGKYGSHIFFAEVQGKQNVVCFKDFVSHLVNEKWLSDLDTDNDRARSTVITAAKLIGSQLREMTYDLSTYPDMTQESDISNFTSVIPSLLLTFLQHLVPDALKQASLGQAIVQSAKPRTSLMPLLLQLGIQLDHKYGSAELITELSRLGFCTSHYEVRRYKQSVVASSTGWSMNLPADCEHPFVQFIADNVDHNTRTLTGSGTFHGMGIISASVFQHGQFKNFQTGIPRLKEYIKANDIVKDCTIQIVPFKKNPNTGLSSVTFQELNYLRKPIVLPESMILNDVWHIAGYYCNADGISDDPQIRRQNWAGFMSRVCTGNHAPPALIQMLPIIDLYPGDESCIYSTLLFIEGQARRLNITTPCITFDQPLFIKAVDIALSAKLDVVVRLGGFHTMMSYIASVGKLMRGSGLEDALEQIYGKTVVEQILTGKSYARSLRAHILVHSALKYILLQHLLNPSNGDRLPNSIESLQLDAVESEQFKSAVLDVVMQVSSTQPDHERIQASLDLLCSSPVLSKLELMMTELNCSLSQQSRTSKFFLLYCDYIELLKMFLYAERTSNWQLHLHAVGSMIGLFAATGHVNYAKSARLYLQMMENLAETHPWLHEQFMSGLHAIRRSDKFWAGLSTDAERMDSGACQHAGVVMVLHVQMQNNWK